MVSEPLEGPAESRPLLDIGQAARRCHLPVSTVYKLVKQGRMPSIRLGKHLRFDQDDLDDWIDAHRQIVIKP